MYITQIYKVMVEFSDIMIFVGQVLAAISTLLLGVIVFKLYKSKQEIKNDYKVRYAHYPVASAGSEKQDSKQSAQSVSIVFNEFRSKEGKILDPSNYDQYVVDGESMKYCGIHSGDLLFVRKGFKINDLKPFPTILVLRKRNSDLDKPKYKVRRAWAYCNIDDDLKSILEAIMDPQNFKSVRDIEHYDSDRALIEDFFKTRLERYRENYINIADPCDKDKEVVISTTYHTDEQKVRFSIHPISTIMGVVEESFTIKTT